MREGWRPVVFSLFSFLQVCVGPATREDCRPLVFSLFFRCALDRP
ncbi:hypothetical protein AB205_0068920 [Aquarana catesbeiana]|uniref:Uncharacterized protein n=1 Tax=Aquarana catesbeiana TaxID=8400 RepID=A0A2G9Q803_AQUCT|nr:hypothetical protein AB205_0068920 [Aquarana catesbeiana]PIO11201.1 hypothetical protein AB205_0068920 [Aquarana catesbeiana]